MNLNTLLCSVVVLLGGSTLAGAHKRPLALTSLVLRAGAASSPSTSSDHGATVDTSTGAGVAVTRLPADSKSFVEFHSARVENDLMRFQPTLVGLTPPGVSRNAGLLSRSPEKKIRFFVPIKSNDDLEMRRDRDRLLLFREPQPMGSGMGLGIAMFGAMTILSAHAPRPFRVLFDGPVHFGPAIFDGGGMGAGFAGRL
jgi:hypothetical protein